MPLAIGIDPGEKSGHAVALDGVSYVSTVPLTASYRELGRWFHAHSAAKMCVVEKVVARPGFGITSQAGLVASMERAKQAASVLDCDCTMLTPQQWQGLPCMDLIMGNVDKLPQHQYKKMKKQAHLARLLEVMDFEYEDGGLWRPTVEQADAFLLAYIGLTLLETKEKTDF